MATRPRIVLTHDNAAPATVGQAAPVPVGLVGVAKQLSPSGRELSRMQSSFLRSPTRLQAAGGGLALPPANVRRVSNSIEDVLVPPRARVSPARVSPARGRGGMPSYARQFSSLSNPAAAGAASNGDHKPCSELNCAQPRMIGEGYCKAHLSESRAGLALRHKRTPSVLQRMLNQHTSPPRVNGIARPGRHGLGSVSAYELMGIKEDQAKHAAKHPPMPGAPLSPEAPQHHAPIRVKADVSPVRRAPKPTPASRMSAQQVAKFVRHTSLLTRGLVKNGAAGAFTASAAGAVAAALQSSNPSPLSPSSMPGLSKGTSLDDPAVLLSRHNSYQLPVESMPAAIGAPSVAALDFHDYYFSLPTSLDAFIAWRERVSATPEGATVALIVAMLLWSEGKELQSGGFAWKGGPDGTTGPKVGSNERKTFERMAEDEAAAAVSRTLGRQVSSMRTSQAAAANAANVQEQLLRRAVGAPPPIEEDDEQKQVVRRLESLVRRPNQLGLPGAGNLSKPTANRLASFRRDSPAAKKLTFNARARAPPTATGEASGLPADAQLAVWSWCALIACIHPDQTVHSNRTPAAAGAPLGAAVSYRGRSLCSVDVDAFNDTWEVSPALARSFVLGTLPQHDFALEAKAPGHQQQHKRPAATESKDADDEDWGDRASSLRLLGPDAGPHAVRIARHPFAGGTADLFNEGNKAHASALLMVHNTALRFPRSIKLRKDNATGRWKVVHFFNLLSAPVRRFAS